MEIKKLMLNSLNKQEYSDKEIDCKVVENMKEYAGRLVEQALQNGGVQIAKKTVKVTARLGQVGEEVDTRPRVERDGKVYVIGETKGKVKVEGSMIVVNPDGEEYIVKPEAFAKKYQATSEKDVYLPIAQPISYVILTEDIAFKAPWGEDMYGCKGAALNVSNLDEVYAIQNEAFKKTYTEFEKEDDYELE